MGGEGGHGQGHDSRSRSKRRSKNDDSGRDFICGCRKKYLSYPALYTHIRTKHDGNAPSGTNMSKLLTGRGRGRPRKTHGDIEKNIKHVNINLDADDPMNLSGLLINIFEVVNWD
jgi:hypothetical protein